MSVIILTSEERKRFAAYLEQEANTNNLLAKQMDKIGPHGKIMSEEMRSKALASIIIARELMSWEEQNITR